jgi:hypothetical protein
MRVTINGSGNILTHGDSLSGGGVIEFPINEPPEFASTLANYTVTGSAPSQKLNYQGHEIAVETPTATAERVPDTSSLPEQWVVDSLGNLRIEPDASGGDVDASLIVKGNGRSDTFMIERQLTTERTFGIDEDGYLTGGGASFGDTAAIANFGLVVRISGGPVNTAPNGSYFVVRESGVGLVFFRVKGDGNVLMPNLPASDPAVAGALWNDAGTVKVSAG